MSKNIRKASSADIASIVKIHKEAFPGHFMTKAGSFFLKKYYGLVLDYSRGILLVSTKNDKSEQPNGFIAGFVDPEQFYSLMSQQKWLFAFAILPALVLRPWLINRLLHNRKTVSRKASSTGSSNGELTHKRKAELASIAVSPFVQTRGNGKRLVTAFLAECNILGARQVYLTTDVNDNEAVNQFYLKLGFMAQPESLSSKDRPMYKYTKDL